MAHQLEQLLTCCICLDRYRNPKLLPCQHSVCMEPCMEGLVDYVRRQVKCPECRAEHRIPYNGVQGFPSNVTLQRFLEAHIEITGETPDPHTGQYMERCSVCNEKAYLSCCVHCDKKVCPDCKAAHTDILKREIGRINNQVKRAAHRLNEQLEVVERNLASLKVNTSGVTEEVDNISKRLQKAVRDRCDFLKSEVENYYNTELRSLTLLKEGLDQEISNVDANIDLAEKHMDDRTPWDDAELMDTKDVFLRTMEFIRSFDYDPGEYSRRARFNPPDDLNKLVTNLSNLGDLAIHQTNKPESYGSSQSGGLMKSKSDHRLAAQFRDQDEYGGRTSPLPRRRFGERPVEKEEETDSGRRKFRSRFMNRHEDEDKSVRFSEDEAKPRARVIDTEDVSRGPLSGITRLYDSPRVIKRLQERDAAPKKKKEEGPKTPTTVPKTPFGNLPPQRKPSRQTSNEDEIDKIKKQNKEGSTSTSTSASASASASASRPAVERLSSLKDDERQSRSDRSSVSPRSSTHSPSSVSHDRDYGRTDYGSSTGSGVNGSRATPSRKSSLESGTQRTYPFSRSSSTSSVGEGRSARPLDVGSIETRMSRSNSTDSNKSHEGSASPTKKQTGAAFSTDELKNRFQRTSRGETSRPSAASSTGSPGFSSRFLGRAGTPPAEASKESTNEDEEESSEDSESEESDDSSEEEEKEEKSDYSKPDIGLLLGRSTFSRDSAGSSSRNKSGTGGTDSGYGSRYGSSNSDNSGSRYGSSNSDNSSSSSTGRYGVGSSSTTNDSSSSYRRPSYMENKKEKDDEFDSKYPYASKYLSRSKAAEEETKSPFQSRFLNKSKSSAVLGPDSTANDDDSSSTAGMGTSRARFEELKERRQRLARSKSSAGMDDDETSTTPADTSSSSRYTSRYSTRDSDTSSPSSRSTTSSAAGGDDGGSSSAQLSTWARYLKNKYGNKTTTGASGTSSPSPSSSTSTSTSTSSSLLGRGSSGLGSSSTGSGLGSSSTSSTSSSASSRPISRSRSSHLLGLAKEDDTPQLDESKNAHATPTSQQADIQVPTPFGSFYKNQYLQKQRLLFKIGSRGSEPECFTWPRGIAVGPDNSIVVADSSNHRVQVFSQDGVFLKSFGCYGNGVGEFDCLAGVAVNRIGQYIIADRYNHRIQIFDPTGTFLRAFGNQGSGDGKFSYPWGVATDALGFIYVCDKENHRIQVFQSDGSFVGKFGTMGSKPGQLEHPHYIAVSSTNRVIVSDSNNHRIQIFDVNGKIVSTFGEEGSAEGQFKFPRGVGVDEQGYIFAADSGNNRIQLFTPDGAFIRAFGCWGSADGEFKGLEGVAVMSNGNVLVCDRENHRLQVF